VFANFILRVRAADAAAGAIGAGQFLDEVGDANNAATLLLVGSYPAPGEPGLRAVLVDKGDWRKREREAAALQRQLATQQDMLRLARAIRFHDLFLLLGATQSRNERAIYKKLEHEYLTGVSGPHAEEVFFHATDGIVREVLLRSMGEEDATRYFRQRAEQFEKLHKNTSERSFPFVHGRALDLYEARLFDLEGHGPEHFVIASVHV
jgi:hypothetical protein